MIKGFKIPCVTFKMRVRDESVGGDNPYRWQDVTSDSLLKGKRVVLFSLPGAFTPTCSTYQLPGFEENYDNIRNQDIDEVYCISVNDAFVMNAWARDLGIKNVKMIPDGDGTFTRSMGMLVNKPKQGFGMRSWRYAAIVNDGTIEKMFIEPGQNDFSDDDDPYTVSSPEHVLSKL